jgi:hypothetical protein
MNYRGRQSNEVIYAQTAEMNNYNITETIYDDVNKSFEDRNTSEINKKALIKKNFALPPNKSVKVWSKERQHRNKSNPRENLDSNKDVTLYIGAVDIKRTLN